MRTVRPKETVTWQRWRLEFCECQRAKTEEISYIKQKKKVFAYCWEIFHPEEQHFLLHLLTSALFVIYLHVDV